MTQILNFVHLSVMKLTGIILLGIFYSAFESNGFTSEAIDLRQLIIGTWQATKCKNCSKVSMSKVEIRRFSFSFTDSTCIEYYNRRTGMEVTTGNWQISDDGQTLISTNRELQGESFSGGSAMSRIEYRIIELNEKRLILHQKIRGYDEDLYLHFVKTVKR